MPMIDIISPSKAAIIYNTQKKSIETLYKELGCSHIINAGFFNMSTFKPLMWLVLNGKVISSDQYNDWGLAIESGLPVMSTDRGGDFVSLIPILRGGEKVNRNLTPDVARKAERSAIGWTKDGKLILAVTDAVVRETLQNYMVSYGAVDALMCDGGGSAQGIFPSGKVLTGRKVPTLIAVWTAEQKKEADPIVAKAPQQKVIELARSQIGVTENPKNSNKQKYGQWYGANGAKWCVIFVDWVFNFAGEPLPYKTASCGALHAWYQANRTEQLHSTPEAGDIVLYDWGHCGIVTEVGKTTIKAVEGNTSATIVGSQDNGGGVYERTRDRSKVTVYIRPYKEEKTVTVVLSVLRKGSKGDEVKTLQILLNGYGYSCGKADGDFGSKTETALIKYQKAKKLGADGVCGQATWTALLG